MRWKISESPSVHNRRNPVCALGRYQKYLIYLNVSNVDLAEPEGFEPSIHLSAYNALAKRRLQPLGHSSEVDRYRCVAAQLQAAPHPVACFLLAARDCLGHKDAAPAPVGGLTGPQAIGHSAPWRAAGRVVARHFRSPVFPLLGLSWWAFPGPDRGYAPESHRAKVGSLPRWALNCDLGRSQADQDRCRKANGRSAF
jgi:hypothetical protein